MRRNNPLPEGQNDSTDAENNEKSVVDALCKEMNKLLDAPDTNAERDADDETKPPTGDY